MREQIDGSARESLPVTDRVWTVPNALSMLRLVGVPIFLWLILSRHDDWAVVVLTISGVTDYLDGKIARAYNLVSSVGQLLDPLADRLYILSTLLGLAWREIIPWWLVAVLVGREVFGTALLMVVRHYGYRALPVSCSGKVPACSPRSYCRSDGHSHSGERPCTGSPEGCTPSRRGTSCEQSGRAGWPREQSSGRTCR